jgi:SAM-dependent methyltransferase
VAAEVVVLTRQEPHGAHGAGTDARDAAHWDELYSSRDQLFSGLPNDVLVTEVAQLTPGQALDVGCGEGADAIWLASRGWLVTALDLSMVALRRAARSAIEADVAGRVAWTRADLADAPLASGAFDLVSMHYFPLPKQQPHHTELRRLLCAVAPGGTLLFVGHDPADIAAHREQQRQQHAAAAEADRHGEAHDDGDDHGLGAHGDPDAYYQPPDVIDLLDDSWTVLVHERRPRARPGPDGTNHVNDIVLLARRAS